MKLISATIVLLTPFLTTEKTDIIYNPSLRLNYEISYSPNYKLKWSDFSVKQSKKGEHAVSYTGFYYTYSWVNNKLIVQVNCIFDKNLSYVINQKESPNILNHEQRHFDITYIYSQKLINELRAEKNLTENKILYIYNKILQELDDFQKKYDLETNHSLNKESQKYWDNMIKTQLENIN